MSVLSVRALPVKLAVLGAGAALSLVTVFVGSASAATGTVHTSSGASVNVRSGPHTSSSIVGTKANGATVTISCQTHGDTVTGKYGTSNVWDKVGTGYISDTYVYTGSDGMVAPLCGSSTGGGCSISGTGDPHTCAQAVTWAKNHITTSYHSDYYRRCDHIVGLAYGFPASGSVTAQAHWNAIPARFKHAGDRSVPAGGLAFFSTSSSGHVMISIGSGTFVSNDIHGNGTYTKTTIHEIESKWGAHYLGWAQPWFQYNH